MANDIEKNNGEIIIYQSEDGKIRLDVRLEDKTVWLTQEQIAMLFRRRGDCPWIAPHTD